MTKALNRSLCNPQSAILNLQWMRALLAAGLSWLQSGTVALGQANGQTYPPPAGAGIDATLAADQDTYTNQAATAWCPACVSNWPPCKIGRASCRERV